MAKIINSSTVTSKYSLPDGTQHNSQANSNTSLTENMTLSLEKVRSTERDFGMPKDEIKQTITFTNNSDYDISEATVTDSISANATFKKGSVYINNTPSPDSDPTTGIVIPNGISKYGGTATITYDLVIDDTPTTDTTTLQATIAYSVAERDDLVEKTNSNEITIEQQKLKIEMTSNKSAVISGDTLLFQNVITNEGNLANTDIVFKNDLPSETTFIAGSVTIDEVEKASFDPTVGFPLGDMLPGASVTVKYSVTVN